MSPSHVLSVQSLALTILTHTHTHDDVETYLEHDTPNWMRSYGYFEVRPEASPGHHGVCALCLQCAYPPRF